MTRIAMVTDSFLPRLGGIELHVRDLSMHLARAGHDVHIVSPFPGDGPVPGVTIDQVSAALWPRFQFSWTPNAAYRLEKHFRDGAFDVAHHHMSIFSPFTVSSLCVCLGLGIPVVVTSHSLWREYARALAWLDRMFSWSTRPIVISGVSAAVANDLAPLVGNQKVEVLPDGIDPQFWKVLLPRFGEESARGGASRRDDGVVRIVSVMRLVRRKRPRVLLDIIDRLKAELAPGTRVHLQIVGEGTERVYLEDMIRSRSLSAYVELLGFRTRHEIRAIFGQSDLFVLPTAEEAFGIAALEARTAGLPVVALRTGGVGEIIEHDVEGLLADTDHELLSHVATLVRDSALRKRIAAHNRRTNPGDCWPNVVAKHERAYAIAAQRMHGDTPGSAPRWEPTAEPQEAHRVMQEAQA